VATGYRPDIEGMRALAIIAVLLCHAGVAFAAGGYVGVDVFFVISGFLITRLLLGELDSRGTVSLSRFYARRIRRLLPLSALLLAVVAALSLLIFSPVRADEVAHDIISCATYTANWHFAAQSVDYFAQGNQTSPVQHLWSLAIEEQFYLVWPTLLLAVTWLWRRRGRSPRPALAVALAAILIASFLFNLDYTREQPAAAYFSTLGRAWELGLGATLALLGELRLRRAPAALLGWAGLAAIVYATLDFSATTRFPGSAALVPTLGAAALILAGSAAENRRRGAPAVLLGTAPARYVGRISYSWYLWHWPFLVFAAALWGPLSPTAGIAVVAASWIPTELGHVAIEEPFRHARRLVAMPRRALGVGLACTAIAVGSALLLVDLQPTFKTAAPSAVAGALMLRSNKAPEESAEAIRPNPFHAWSDRGLVYSSGCLVGVDGTNSDKCLFGDAHGKRTMILFGDSHAMQYFPPLEGIAKRNNLRLIALNKAECTPALIQVRSMIADREYSECDTWREDALERIEAAKRGSIVVLVSDTAYVPYGPHGEELRGKAAALAMEAAYITTLTRLHEAGMKTVVLTDSPAAPDEVPACVSEHLEQLGACAWHDPRKWNQEFEVRAAHRSPGSHLVSLVPEICPDGTCRPVIGNALTYRDDSHLSATFARTLRPWIERALRRAGLIRPPDSER
jgi:peptidoglycan/LPS O-acetylase OafA/YrhL